MSKRFHGMLRRAEIAEGMAMGWFIFLMIIIWKEVSVSGHTPSYTPELTLIFLAAVLGKDLLGKLALYKWGGMAARGPQPTPEPETKEEKEQ